MTKFYKITNENEIHNNFIYKDGLNILTDSIDTDKNNLGNGLYFTTIDYIPKYYYLGINLREIELPSDSDFLMINMDNDKYRANKIILGKKYSLYDPQTYVYFGLNMEYNIHLVDHASEHANIDFLIKWEENKWNLKYSANAIDLASFNGHIEILDWWKNSGFKLKYSSNAIEWACQKGHSMVLDWWWTSGLEFKYSHKAILLALKNGHKNIIQWFNNNLIKSQEHNDDNNDGNNNNDDDNDSNNDSSNDTIINSIITWTKNNGKMLLLNLILISLFFLFLI